MRIHTVKIFILLIATGLIFNSYPLAAQEAPVQDGFIGRGIAKIVSGDVETARQQALSDAQRKAIFEALSAQMPLEVIENNFLILKTTFLNKPATYIQSFRILNENTTFDFYQVSIQAQLQQDILKKGLEEIGLVGQQKEPIKILLMVAEKSAASVDYVYWWASPEAAVKLSESDQKLRDILIERGFTVIDPLQTIKELPASLVSQNTEPDVDTVCRLGAQCGADMAIVGKAEIQRSKGTESSSFSAFQCNLKANAISVKDHRVIVSPASYGLGVNTDEAVAYKSSIEKACKQLSDQIMDKTKLLPWGPR